MILDIDQIVVTERIRQEGKDDVTDLTRSIKSLGLLQPIIVRSKATGYELVAGERRLLAIKQLHTDRVKIPDLEPGKIQAAVVGHIPPHVQLMMEFDENDKRKDFSYVDKSRFIRKFHEAMEEQARKVDRKWNNEHTAAALRLSPASISHYLRVEEAIKTDPTVAKAQTLDAAVKRMKILEAQKVRLGEIKKDTGVVLTKAEECIRLGNALELIKAIPDASVDLINFDPPWGDETSRKPGSNWGDSFDDDTETADLIINGLLPELFRVLKNDRFMIYWYRTWAYTDMIGRLESAGFSLKFSRTPNIWFKPDKITDQNRYPEKQLIDTYETFFFARKGEPNLQIQGRQNVFVYERVPRAALIHPTEKPLLLCEDLVKLTSMGGEQVLDPTAGSASFLHAALRNGRKAFGFELSPTIRERAILRLAEYLKVTI